MLKKILKSRKKEFAYNREIVAHLLEIFNITKLKVDFGPLVTILTSLSAKRSKDEVQRKSLAHKQFATNIVHFRWSDWFLSCSRVKEWILQNVLKFEKLEETWLFKTIMLVAQYGYYWLNCYPSNSKSSENDKNGGTGKIKQKLRNFNPDIYSLQNSFVPTTFA